MYTKENISGVQFKIGSKVYTISFSEAQEGFVSLYVGKKIEIRNWTTIEAALLHLNPGGTYSNSIVTPATSDGYLIY